MDTRSLINADFSQRVVIDTHEQPWISSPELGVERQLLDRIDGKRGRETSLVRYAAGSRFPIDQHAGSEEFLVLSGAYSDEHGDYPVGAYVRYPPAGPTAPLAGRDAPYS